MTEIIIASLLTTTALICRISTTQTECGGKIDHIHVVDGAFQILGFIGGILGGIIGAICYYLWTEERIEYQIALLLSTGIPVSVSFFIPITKHK